MKAKSVGIRAEDYETGRSRISTSSIPAGIWWRDPPRSDRQDKQVWLGSFQGGRNRGKSLPNENFILRNSSQSILSMYVKETDTMNFVEKKRAYGIQPRNANRPSLSMPQVSGYPL
jgi:predicted ribonuclease YlaK